MALTAVFTPPQIRSGTGSPNSVVIGSVGDLYRRTNGGSGTTLYVKESGTATTTGWVAVAAGGGGAWGGDEVWIEDFGGAADGSAAGTGTDNGPPLAAAIAALDPNRGGTINFNQGIYYFGTATTCGILGVCIQGESNPGNGTQTGTGKGCTQFVAADGITWLTFNPGAGVSQWTRGPVLKNFHLYPETGATTGNGILAQVITGGIVEDVMCTDFVGGYGFKLDGQGSGGNSQYWDFRGMFGMGGCDTGLHLKAANGCRLFGGYFEAGLVSGGTVTPHAGSVGIYVESGDTFRSYGTVLSGWETAIHVASPAANHEFYGPRFEYCNTGIRTSGRRTHVYGGAFGNNLLGGVGAKAASIAVQLDSGATNCYLNLADLQDVGFPIVDNSADVTNEWHLNFDAQPRHQMAGMTAAPASGAHVVGEIVYHATPAASGFIGWVCTTAGTPGTWKTWGAISP